ncbi:hypothetical protein DAI22_06g049950 [Oryza sativa Japonica Group]|nr:hypothetical protein DAI22_06g049950 [Oryza sativa Japonica Group]
MPRQRRRLEEFRITSTPLTKNTIPAIAAVGGTLRFILCEWNADEMCTVHFDLTSPPDRPLRSGRQVRRQYTGKAWTVDTGNVWLLQSDGELFQVLLGFLDFADRKISAVSVYRMTSPTSCRAWRACPTSEISGKTTGISASTTSMNSRRLAGVIR